MALALSKEQLAKLNKKDILQLLLESMEQEKELRSQLAVLTDELKRTNQQMQVILEKWNLAQATRFGRSSEKMTYDTGACQQLELAIMYAECFNEAEACFFLLWAVTVTSSMSGSSGGVSFTVASASLKHSAYITASSSC